MAFSLVRNCNGLNLSPTRYDHGKEVKVINGVKSMATLIAMWGSTILFSYYAILGDTVFINERIKSWNFTLLVGSSLYSIPVLFLCSGFLHAHGLLRLPAAERMSCTNIGKYYKRRILRFIPLLIGTLVLAACIPFFGGSPYWETYHSIIEPCKTYWWTVPLFVNNIIPSTGGMDAKCMPFNWFIPAMI
jgi:hypothetical protein